MEQHEKKPEKYQAVRLPHAPWQAAGERLILPAEVKHTVVRFVQGRLEEQEEDEDSGILLLDGPPGTGKSCMARFGADAGVQRTGKRGNALLVQTAALFSEELGRSAKLVTELFQAIELGASRGLVIVIWDDAEGILTSRQQVIASRDPTDLMRVTTVLNKGFDELIGVKNVVQIATANMMGVIDPAVVDRIDHVLTFRLPTFAERREIIRRRAPGLAGEVLDTLAEATEGWSGRRLAKLPLQAYLLSTVRTRSELSAADYLRAVGLTDGNGAAVRNGKGAPSISPAEAVAVSVTADGAGHQNSSHGTHGQEGEVCRNGQTASSRNGSQQAPSPRPTKSKAPSSWFERLQRCPSFPPLSSV